MHSIVPGAITISFLPRGPRSIMRTTGPRQFRANSKSKSFRSRVALTFFKLTCSSFLVSLISFICFLVLRGTKYHVELVALLIVHCQFPPQIALAAPRTSDRSGTPHPPPLAQPFRTPRRTRTRAARTRPDWDSHHSFKPLHSRPPTS